MHTGNWATIGAAWKQSIGLFWVALDLPTSHEHVCGIAAKLLQDLQHQHNYAPLALQPNLLSGYTSLSVEMKRLEESATLPHHHY